MVTDPHIDTFDSQYGSGYKAGLFRNEILSVVERLQVLRQGLREPRGPAGSKKARTPWIVLRDRNLRLTTAIK